MDDHARRPPPVETLGDVDLSRAVASYGPVKVPGTLSRAMLYNLADSSWVIVTRSLIGNDPPQVRRLGSVVEAVDWQIQHGLLSPCAALVGLAPVPVEADAPLLIRAGEAQPAPRGNPRRTNSDGAAPPRDGTVEGKDVWLCGKKHFFPEVLRNLLEVIAPNDRTPVKHVLERCAFTDRRHLHSALNRLKNRLHDLKVPFRFRVDNEAGADDVVKVWLPID
jgi:hypothetical protein